MLTLIAQLIGELLIQILANAMAEIIGRGALEVFRRPYPVSVWLAAVGYMFWGVFFGWLSLLIFPSGFITQPPWPVLNLLLTPVVVGLLMARWGQWLRDRGLTSLRFDSFFYGYLFALSVALIRYLGVR